MSVVTLLAVTSCSTIHTLPPRALAATRARNTSKIGRSLEPGRWYLLHGYTDSQDSYHSVSGRVRAIPGDSLELDLYLSSSSVTPSSHRSVVPRDSISFIELSEIDAVQSLLVAGTFAAVIIFVVVQLRNAYKQLGSIGW